MVGKNDVQHQDEAAHNASAGKCDCLMTHRDDEVRPLSALQTGNKGSNLIQQVIWDAHVENSSQEGKKTLGN